MPEVDFYRQTRFDGGVRMGINVEGDSVWERFDPGDMEQDPAILWYVDVRCKGDAIPTDRDAVRHWFLNQGPVIKPALMELSNRLRVGFDDEILPYQFVVPRAPAGTSMKIVCSAVGGLEVGTLGNVLRESSEKWEDLLGHLLPAEAVI